MPEMFKDWDAKDTGLLAAALLATLADFETTKSGIAHGGSETNPLYPKHPRNRTLNAIAALSGGFGAATAGVLPSSVRKQFLGALTGAEATIAYQNYKGSGGPSFSKNLQRPLIGALIGAALASYLGPNAPTLEPTIDPSNKPSLALSLRRNF